MTSLSFAAAGRRRAPAAVAVALLAALVATAPAAAQEPVAKTSPTTPAADPAPVAPVTSAGPRPLRLLAAEAKAVVVAEVARTDAFDDGRLNVYRLHAVRVLRGTVGDPEPAVVDMRADVKVRPLLEDGEQAVILLAPAPAYSYLAQKLPAGVASFTIAGGRDGAVRLAGDADRAAAERALADGQAVATLPEEQAVAARRRLAFDELGVGNARLVADGVAELRLLPALAGVTAAETAAVTKVLADTHADAQTRIALIGLLADRGVTDCLPALKAAAADTPDVLDALLAARTRLGTPPTRAELAPILQSDDARMRAAAVRALARLDDPAALGDVGRFATTDRDAGVRGAAVDALGATHRDAALPVLKRTFNDASKDVVQRSARAVIAIGGTGADDTLTDLALHGGSTDVQRYAALVLVVTRGKDAPAVRQLAAANPSPEVREVLEHPLEFNHRHVEP